MPVGYADQDLGVEQMIAMLKYSTIYGCVV